MKVKNIIFVIFAVSLCCLSVFVGVILMQKNNQPIAVIDISVQSQTDSAQFFVFVNQKDKIVELNAIDDCQNFFQNKKIAGISIKEFSRILSTDYAKQFIGYKMNLSINILGENYECILSHKKSIETEFAKTQKEENPKLIYSTKINAQTTNLHQKYQPYSQYIDEEIYTNKNLIERELLKHFMYNLKINA